MCITSTQKERKKSKFTLDVDFFGILCMDAGKYVDNMCYNYSHLFPGSPISKKYRQTLETNDHQKLDVSVFYNKN